MAIEEVSSARLAAETRPAGLMLQQRGGALGVAPHYDSAAASAKATMAAAGGILLLVSGEGLLAHTSRGGASEAASGEESSSRGGALAPPPPVHTSLPHHVEAELSSAWRRLAVLLDGLSAAPGTAVPLTVFVVLPGPPAPSTTLPAELASAPAATGSYAAALRTSSSPKGAAGASRTVVATASAPSAIGSAISAAEASAVEAAREHLSAAAAAWPEALRRRVKGLRILPLLPHRRPEVGGGGGALICATGRHVCEVAETGCPDLVLPLE